MEFNKEVNMENIKVRKIKREDSKRIWEIRNHPLMRQNSNNQEETPFEKHDQWFENKYFKTNRNHCFVLENEGEKKVVGYCRFDFDDEEGGYVVSIAVDAGEQGRGFGSFFLGQALAMMAAGSEFIAQTFKNNIPSRRIFEKNDFKLSGEDDDSYYFKLKK